MAAHTNDNADGSNANASAFLPSPNRIPPRTSSSSYTYITPTPPAKSVLRPVPESDWLAQSIHSHSKPPSTSHSTQYPTDTMTSTDFQDPSRYATEDFDYVARKTWTRQKEATVLGPFNYLFSQPGKDVRTQLINAFNVWLEVPKDTLDIISNVVAMLHTSSLLVDDVEDNASLRRGQPVAHEIFGTAQTINSANYVYFCALQELQKLKNPRALSIFSEELINLHRGQGMDLYWRDSLKCPTEDEYLEMVGNKTGGLFRLAIKLMQAESKALLDCVPLVNILGIIFQIQDDYRNLSSPIYGDNKGFCEDLTEGKFSFLIIHSIRANPGNLELLNILKQKTMKDTVKQYAVKYMESTGSFEYTKKVLDVLIERARKTANELSGDAEKSIGIHKILDKLVV
ncbi:isoprenoid synthase domain-containing protein [Xylaria digitata]|nr:isoprenoid synthase domain-containing protein [Xylaria digitata]